MAFDIYVGSFTRFYRREWENAAQRHARESGQRYRMIHAGGEPPSPPPKEELRAAVVAWRAAMNGALEPHGITITAWDESDDAPYFSDRPGWDGYNALLVWAARSEHPELGIRTSLPESFADDEAFAASAAPGFRSRYTQILRPEVWLPTEMPFAFGAIGLTGEQTMVGSAQTLLAQLRALNDATFRATDAQLAGAVAEGPYDETLESVAKFGLAMFHELATKAVHQRLPMKTHF